AWADHVARAGYDFYLVDVRGYGRSTRPAAMDAPTAENPPFATTVDVVKDVSAAVDFILKRRGVSKLNLAGWSWGTAIMAGYTMNNNERVNKLLLYAPLWHLKAPPPFSGSGAYRVVSRDAARQRGIRGIPPQRVEEISPTAWFDAWWQANLATDPVGAKQKPAGGAGAQWRAQGHRRLLGRRQGDVGAGDDSRSHAADSGRVGPGHAALHGARDLRQARPRALQAPRGDRRGHPHGRPREEPYASDQPGTELS